MDIEMVYVGKDKKRGTRALALKLPTKKADRSDNPP